MPKQQKGRKKHVFRHNERFHSSPDPLALVVTHADELSGVRWTVPISVGALEAPVRLSFRPVPWFVQVGAKVSGFIHVNPNCIIVNSLEHYTMLE